MGCHTKREEHVKQHQEGPLMVATSSHLLAIYDGYKPKRPLPYDEASHSREENGRPEH